MWFFSRKNEESKRLQTINEALESSFHHVCQDTALIFRWLNYLYHQNAHQQNIVNELQKKLSQISSFPTVTQDEVRRLVEEHFRIRSPDAKVGEMLQRMAQLEQRLGQVQAKRDEALQQIPAQNEQFSTVLEKIREINERISILDRRKPVEVQIERESAISHLKDKIIKKITRNSKAHVQNFIFNLIQKYKQATGLQLREIVVEEQGLCSKSSFYRLLTELEEQGKIEVVSQGKEKLYASKVSESVVEE